MSGTEAKVQNLTPEQKAAIEVFVAALPRWREYYTEQLPTNIFENNSRFFIPSPLKKEHFPREPHWTWNRSNGTVVIDLYQQFRIRLAKFNSRRRKTAVQKQPSFKIWSYSVTVLQSNEEFSFIWCTKGKTRTHRDPLQREQKNKQTAEPVSSTNDLTLTNGTVLSSVQSNTYPNNLYSTEPSISPNKSATNLTNVFAFSNTVAANIPPSFSPSNEQYQLLVRSNEMKYVSASDPIVSPNSSEAQPDDEESVSSADLSLADYSFLKHFTTPDIAIQLGWVEANTKYQPHSN